MKFSNTKTAVSLLLIFAAVLFLLSFTWFPTGYVGTTKKNGGTKGCVCHGSDPTPSVSVTVTGPDSVAAGDTATYTVRISNGPAGTGGFNIASQFGTLDTIPGNFTRKQDDELTHSAPKLFSGNTVSWDFKYISLVPITDTLFATGNSTNDDTTTSNDEWNWSANKNIRVYIPIGIINISSIAKDFSLGQNYPNPFNPNTNIEFSVAKSSDIMLKVYDILGNEIAVLVDKKLNAGQYKVDYNSAGMASGAYFYVMYSEGVKLFTKKMLIVK